MELALDVREVKRPSHLVLVFQSLFSWNLLLMGRKADLLTRFGNVSILVFVELALDDMAGKDLSPGQAMFQSLFSWNLLLMSLEVM